MQTLRSLTTGRNPPPSEQPRGWPGNTEREWVGSLFCYFMVVCFSCFTYGVIYLVLMLLIHLLTQYHIISYHIKSYHINSYSYSLSYHVISYHIIYIYITVHTRIVTSTHTMRKICIYIYRERELLALIMTYLAKSQRKLFGSSKLSTNQSENAIHQASAHLVANDLETGEKTTGRYTDNRITEKSQRQLTVTETTNKKVRLC